MKKEATVNYKGAQHFLQLSAEVALPYPGPKGPIEMVQLRDNSGAFSMTVPQAMVPFATPGEIALIALTFIQAEIVQVSNIIRPGSEIIGAKSH